MNTVRSIVDVVRKIWTTIEVVALIVATVVFAVFLLFLIGKTILEPLAPLITLLLVVLFTVSTFKHWTTTTLSVGGIVLYAASWPMTEMYGTWIGMSFWGLGIIAWFSAVCRTCSRKYRTPILKENGS